MLPEPITPEPVPEPVPVPEPAPEPAPEPTPVESVSITETTPQLVPVESVSIPARTPQPAPVTTHTESNKKNTKPVITKKIKTGFLNRIKKWRTNKNNKNK